MGLAELAASDAKMYLGDLEGFARTITFQSPLGVTAPVSGLYMDTAMKLDPDTRMPVLARDVYIVVHVDNLYAAGLDVPVATQKRGANNWYFFISNGIDRSEVKYRVKQSAPDRSLGIVTIYGEQCDDQ